MEPPDPDHNGTIMLLRGWANVAHLPRCRRFTRRSSRTRRSCASTRASRNAPSCPASSSRSRRPPCSPTRRVLSECPATGRDPMSMSMSSCTQRVRDRTLAVAPASEPVCPIRGRWRGRCGCSAASSCSCCPRRSPTPRWRGWLLRGCAVWPSRSSSSPLSGPSAAQHVDVVPVLAAALIARTAAAEGDPRFPAALHALEEPRSHAASWL